MSISRENLVRKSCKLESTITSCLIDIHTTKQISIIFQ